MDNSKLYEEIMINRYFNRMKCIRNYWDNNGEAKNGSESSVIDVSGEEYRMYNFSMNRCQSFVYEMIGFLIVKLIKRYQISARYYKLKRDNAHVYVVSGNEDWSEYVKQSQEFDGFLFSINNALYVFKEYGIGNCLPNSLIEIILKENKLKHCFHVSLVEENAFSEIIKHNEDKNDPSRGTGILSLKYFFETFFGIDEYDTFKEYAKNFADKVKDYFGLKIIKTLKTNALHNYRKTVRDVLLNFKISEHDINGRISDTQRQIIDRNFFDNNHEVLIGNSDFAKSFITAEWLHTSLADAENIDQTAIAMGYFKGIEQMLFQFLKLHTLERDGVNRRIFVGKEKTYSDAKGNAILSDGLVNDEDKSKDLTLGSLTGFFGYYDSNKNQHYKRNQDLLVRGINDATYEYIVEVLTEIVGLRNGYFHKDNLEDWSKVEKARNSALLVFYLILGAYNIKECEKLQLGLILANKQDDFYRLCEYMNWKAFVSNKLEIAVFYLNGETNPYSYREVYQDDFITYDHYSEPVYSGVYFKEKGLHIRKATKESIPTEIWEGVLKIDKNKVGEMVPSGPLRKIYVNGKFVG